MKKVTNVLLLLVFLVTVSFNFSFGSKVALGDSSGVVELSIGKNVASLNFKPVPLESKPIIQNGRTLVPLRFVSEAFGGYVDYNPNDKTITVVFDLHTIILKIGSKVAIVDGKELPLDVAPFIEKQSGRTLVPVRFISESIGANVEWNPSNRTIKIIYQQKPLANKKSLTLKVIHAGSLTQPLRNLENNFKNYYAKLNVDITFEDFSAGSVDAVKQITELKKEFDVVALADFFLIPQYLIPKYTDWYIVFATNKLVLCYTDKSKYANEINSNNWYEILLRKDVDFGYSEPNSDPCGYRTLLMFQLAEQYYKKPQLYQSLLNATKPKNIRPKSVELVALLQANELDYAFEYESVAVQNNLKYISFPDELNLGNPDLTDWYEKASLTLKDGTVVKGAPILYGLTIPNNAPEKEFAQRFVLYLLKYGKSVFEKSGQPFVPFKAYPDIYKLPAPVRMGIMK
ncbi:extracellular solute-binding protein [Caldisericum exile]|uniref:extracellular solute-binding protein n=1 Tax=Caldisericum exile TaxID=693075 RepID=UPI003C76B868